MVTAPQSNAKTTIKDVNGCFPQAMDPAAVRAVRNCRGQTRCTLPDNPNRPIMIR
jgi:hypothetical protein